MGKKLSNMYLRDLTKQGVALTSIIPGNSIPVVAAKNGNLIVTIPANKLLWTKEIAATAEEVRKRIRSARKNTLRIDVAASCSSVFLAEVQKMKVDARQNVKMR